MHQIHLMPSFHCQHAQLSKDFLYVQWNNVSLQTQLNNSWNIQISLYPFWFWILHYDRKRGLKFWVKLKLIDFQIYLSIHLIRRKLRWLFQDSTLLCKFEWLLNACRLNLNYHVAVLSKEYWWMFNHELKFECLDFCLRLLGNEYYSFLLVNSWFHQWKHSSSHSKEFFNWHMFLFAWTYLKKLHFGIQWTLFLVCMRLQQ